MVESMETDNEMTKFTDSLHCVHDNDFCNTDV